MLGHRRRRWASIKTTSVERIVFVAEGLYPSTAHIQCCFCYLEVEMMYLNDARTRCFNDDLDDEPLFASAFCLTL